MTGQIWMHHIAIPATCSLAPTESAYAAAGVFGTQPQRPLIRETAPAIPPKSPVTSPDAFTSNQIMLPGQASRLLSGTATRLGSVGLGPKAVSPSDAVVTPSPR